jgi:hypothetical protein
MVATVTAPSTTRKTPTLTFPSREMPAMTPATAAKAGAGNGTRSASASTNHRNAKTCNASKGGSRTKILAARRVTSAAAHRGRIRDAWRSIVPIRAR